MPILPQCMIRIVITLSSWTNAVVTCPANPDDDVEDAIEVQLNEVEIFEGAPIPLSPPIAPSASDSDDDGERDSGDTEPCDWSLIRTRDCLTPFVHYHQKRKVNPGT